MSKMAFYRMKKRTVISLFLMLFIFVSFVNAQEEIETKSVFMKISTTKGEVVAKEITISSGTGAELILSVNGIDGGVTLMERSIILDEGEEKNVEVLFDADSVSEGVYVGNIKIEGDRTEKIIPVIF